MTRREAREKMVARQIAGRDVRDERVLDALRRIKRHLYVPQAHQESAYEDRPLPIGYDQTISQPYIVAKMTELLQLQGTERVLEIGTGSGYQSAVLAELANEVYSIEIVEPLYLQAQNVLEAQGYPNIHLRCGDGHQGWPDAAPFEGILVSAAPKAIPPALLDQLVTGGRLVIPVGDWSQQLRVIVKAIDGQHKQRTVFPVRFVPMTGEAEES